MFQMLNGTNFWITFGALFNFIWLATIIFAQRGIKLMDLNILMLGTVATWLPTSALRVAFADARLDRGIGQLSGTALLAGIFILML